jgi:hypothetical protein
VLSNTSKNQQLGAATAVIGGGKQRPKAPQQQHKNLDKFVHNSMKRDTNNNLGLSPAQLNNAIVQQENYKRVVAQQQQLIQKQQQQLNQKQRQLQQMIKKKSLNELNLPPYSDENNEEDDDDDDNSDEDSEVRLTTSRSRRNRFKTLSGGGTDSSLTLTRHSSVTHFTHPNYYRPNDSPPTATASATQQKNRSLSRHHKHSQSNHAAGPSYNPYYAPSSDNYDNYSITPTNTLGRSKERGVDVNALYASTKVSRHQNQAGGGSQHRSASGGRSTTVQINETNNLVHRAKSNANSSRLANSQTNLLLNNNEVVAKSHHRRHAKLRQASAATANKTHSLDYDTYTSADEDPSKPIEFSSEIIETADKITYITNHIKSENDYEEVNIS